MRLSRLVALVVMSLGGPLLAADPADEFLRVIPGDANSVMVLRVRELVQSPRGQREGWAEKQQDAFLEGTQHIPPWVSVAYRANRVRPEESSMVWSIGIVGAPADVSVARIAEHEQAGIDVVAQTQFVQNSRGSFVSLLAPGVVSVFSPAYRQDYVRWLEFARNNTKSQVSPYLAEMLKSPAHIGMAFDLEYVFPPNLVFAWLQHSAAMKGRTAEMPAVAALLQSIRGVRMEATVAEDTTGKVTVDFGTPVGPHAATVKAVLLEFLEHSGAVIEDLETAKVSAEGNSVILTTKLSDEGLRRALTVITSPNPLSRMAAARSTPQPASQQASLEATKRYYRTCNKYVDDLSERHRRAKNYEKTAVWHDNFAKKIEELSIEGVHPELAKYGQDASLRFKALAASLRGANLKVANLENSVVWNYTVDPGFAAANVWGGVGYRPPTWEANSNLQTVRERQAEAVSRGKADRDQIWQQIENDRKNIRLRMQEIYGVDFDAREK